jgi:hypothetical protein
MGKPWCIVLNMAVRSKILDDTKEKLQALADKLGGHFCPVILMNRMIHAECVGFNMVPRELEPSGKAAEEVTKMTKSVIKILTADLAKKQEAPANG